MKVIKVKNPEEGGKVAFEILKRKVSKRCSNIRTCDR